MDHKPLDTLQQEYHEAASFKDLISSELEETLHQAGEYSERLTRLNNQMALLETSGESDEVVAEKIEALRQDMEVTEQTYSQLMNKETRLVKAELDAINALHDAQSALKIAELKSGKH